jgi:hypothetical protein
MVVSKLSLVILAAVAGGMVWIEHAHRIKIEMSPPPPAELAGVKAAACPENESVPFGADCMKFIHAVVEVDVRSRATAAGAVLPDSPELP